MLARSDSGYNGDFSRTESLGRMTNIVFRTHVYAHKSGPGAFQPLFRKLWGLENPCSVSQHHLGGQLCSYIRFLLQLPFPLRDLAVPGFLSDEERMDFSTSSSKPGEKPGREVSF